MPLFLLNPWFWLVAVSAAIALAGGGYVKGRVDGVAITKADQVIENDRLREERRGEISDWVTYLSARGTARDADLRTAESRAQLANQDLILKVNAYVTPKADRGCTVPYGFVVYHDAAVPRAAGRPAIPAPAGELVDGASGVPLSVVDATVKHNYDGCQLLLDRQAGDRRAYADDCAAWDRKWGTKSECARGSAPQAPSNPQSPKGR